MLRAVIAVLGVLLFASVANAADECLTPADVTGHLEGNYPGIKHISFTGADSESIKAGLQKANIASLEGEREFMVFEQPGGGPVVLIVGFKGGCFEGKAFVRRTDLIEWIGGKGAAK